VTAGPIAAALEQALLGELRRNGTVVWLDATGAYQTFVDRLVARAAAGDFTFPVVAFRGSFLELILALEPFGSGLDNAPLLIHMPGYTEETIRRTPVLELYESGIRFRRSPETLVREAAAGKVAPEALERYIAAGLPSLEAADEWLASQLDTSREGLSRTLETLGVKAVLDHAVDALGPGDTFLRQRVGTRPEREVFRAYLSRQTGMSDAWLASYRGAGAGTGLEDDPNAALAGVLGDWVGWLLSVEYVHDLVRQPHARKLLPLRQLSPPLVKVCVGLVEHLREKHAAIYANLADEAELHLHEELPHLRAEDLGRVDTFRKEEQEVLRGAVEALAAGDWAKVREWAAVRTEERSYWLKRDPARRRAWALVREGAELGGVVAACPRPLSGVKGLDAAVERYTAVAFEVDRAHRRFEQRQATLLDSQVPHFGDLKECVRVLRTAYRAWADQLASDFAKVCRESGFLPEASLQQRNIFEQVVQPLAADDKVAFLLLDAFRYEMATELLEDLKAPGTVVDLKARLAELPTVTAVGMNVLAPVVQGGRLHVAGTFGGFRTGEFTVRAPDDRARAIGQRTAGRQSVLLKLSEVCDLQPEQLKRKIASARVVVVHGTELDDAGEANVGPVTFEFSLRQLRSAWALLQKAGVKSFVFTADHGFLLLDETTRTVPYGTRRDPSPRYVLDELPRAEPGMVNVSLSALGYDGLAGHLLFREDTAVYATGNAGATFVHGGNSPQERIIPVLTVRRARAAAPSHTTYFVEARREKDLMGARQLALRVRTAAGQVGTLGFVARRDIGLVLRVVGRTDVRPVLKDLIGPGAIQDGTLRLPADAEWSQLFFSLDGPDSGRVRIEVYHPENVEKVEPRLLEDWFEVDFRRGAAPSLPAPVTTTASAERELSWADALPDAGARKVFVHLADHGSITEAEVIGFLGSPRAFRRFSLDFDEHVRKVPFRVRIEAGTNGKRYVKEGEK
jgi:hypothetical protein